MYVYVYVCLCMCMCMSVSVYVYVYVCACVCLCWWLWLCVCVYACLYLCMFMCMYMCSCVFMYMYVYVCLCSHLFSLSFTSAVVVLPRQTLCDADAVTSPPLSLFWVCSLFYLILSYLFAENTWFWVYFYLYYTIVPYWLFVIMFINSTLKVAHFFCFSAYLWYLS